MNQELKEAKRIIREFLQEHYSDERLAMLLAHAQSEKLAYESCCCFIGIPTADHALHGAYECSADSDHYNVATRLKNACAAEIAFLWLCKPVSCFSVFDANAARRRRIISIVKAEMRRRARVEAAAEKVHSDLSHVGVLEERA